MSGARTTAPELEALLGDPHQDGPFSYARIIADDDARELSGFAEDVLTAWGAGAEFVPGSLGGRWVSTPALVERLRPVFRRDPAVGLGHGLTTLMAAVNVWVAGSDPQRADVARRLLKGERIAVGFHELAHGNDLLHNECAANSDGTGWVVTGGKQVVNNIHRAESVLLMARTREGAPAARAYSLLLWHRGHDAPGTVDSSRRVLTAGMRGCRIGTVELRGLPVPGDGLIGADGAAAETALRAFQVTRAVIPALAVGAVEAALHETIGYARGRSLYDTDVLSLPHARSLYAEALADTLVADAFSGAVVRALHLAPRECFLLSAASKYLVPQLLLDAMQQISVLAGSTFYARVEPYGIIEKILRDLTVVPIGHAGSTSCMLTMLPLLPMWARRAQKTESADLDVTDLVDVDGLEELDAASLTLGGGSRDVLGAALHDPAVRRLLAARAPSALELVDALALGYADLLDRARAMRPEDATPSAPADAFDIARQVTLYLAAGAVVGAWASAHRRDPDGTHAGIGANPDVLEACLRRVRTRLDGDGAVLPERVVDALVAHGERCVDESRSVGLVSVPVYAGQAAIDSPTPF